jgi:hypothetical protein
MASDLVLGMYSLGGALELGGVIVTALDIRAKTNAWREWSQKGRSDGKMSYGQSATINKPAQAGLSGRWLFAGVAMLILGIIVGTVANALS